MQDLYAAVAHMASLRLFLTIVAVKDLDIIQFDAITAFLNLLIDGDVFVEQPHGMSYDERIKLGNFVCKLKRALYGLKVSPRLWFDNVSGYLKKLGFV